MTNLAYSESRFNPKADNGADRGLFQINRKYHPEVSDDCSFDAECAARWAAQRILDGYSYEWVSANCYAYASLFVKLPRMAQIAPNSPAVVGGVAIYEFKGIKHVAVITGLQEDGFTYKDANRTAGLITTGFTAWDDPNFIGVYTPERSVEG